MLQMKEDDEEGIGTFLNIEHKSPALLNEEVTITAEIIKLEKNIIDCAYKVYIGDRIIATGTQGQKILKKDKLSAITAQIKIN